MKAVWQGRVAQTTAKLGDHAPMATVCCNSCRTCVQTNLLAMAFAGATAAAMGVVHVGRRLLRRPGPAG